MDTLAKHHASLGNAWGRKLPDLCEGEDLSAPQDLGQKETVSVFLRRERSDRDNLINPATSPLPATTPPPASLRAKRGNLIRPHGLTPPPPLVGGVRGGGRRLNHHPHLTSPIKGEETANERTGQIAYRIDRGLGLHKFGHWPVRDGRAASRPLILWPQHLHATYPVILSTQTTGTGKNPAAVSR